MSHTLEADRFPLYWPESWPRTEAVRRQRTGRYKISFAEARDRLVAALGRLGASDLVVSSNVPIRNDGLPKAGWEPPDPGVAVYWTEGKSKVPRVIACDHWDRVRDNMRAVGLAIEALCALKRSGATQVIERAFVGLNALAASNPRHKSWREVFEWPSDAVPSPVAIQERFKDLLLKRHPDHGGTDELLRELVRARTDALESIQ